MDKSPQDGYEYGATMMRLEEDRQRKAQMGKGQVTSEEMVEIIQREKQALEAKIQAHKDEIRAVEKRLAAAQAQVEREKRRRHVFPVGFHFYFNNRRGDPQYTRYWECVLHDASGKEVWRHSYSEDDYTESTAKAAALDAAWKLCDIAEAISAHIRLNSEANNAV
jgi:hypothetical protein